MLSRPQTAKNFNRSKQFLLKSHTPKASSTCDFREGFKNHETKFQKNFVEKNNSDLFEKLKQTVFFLKHEEIVENLNFFDNMKNACKLNFYSACEGVEKTPKNQDLDFKLEDIHNLVLFTLKKLENEVRQPFFINFK